MAELKTFLFTDIVGSVELKGQMPGRSDAERDQAFIELVLSPHRERIERELATLGGRVVSTAGDGHFLVFSDTVLAARWAIGLEESHRDEPIRTPRGGTVAVRVSMHLGIPQLDPRDPNNFVGKPVDYASRLNDYATGGQVLVSRSVVAVLEDAGMDGVTFHRHGKRELRGIGQVDVYELVYDAAGPKKMRPQPRASLSRQWTVLPATVGLTEFQAGTAGGWGRATASPQWQGAGGSPEARPQPPMDTAPPRLGNYLLEERLGSGGMGDVYRARHSQFGRVRAVKVIKQHFVDAGHHEVIRRFYQEIKAVGALEHPNIVVAIDSSSPSDAVHYLVMEYIDGIGADELVARNGPLPVAEACEIARQAARGLAYIHQHGMVHRDIKPSNLMLTLVRTDQLDSSAKPQAEEGDQQAVVKILDLGLALLVGDDQQRLTLFDNRAMGTAMYMSPEQWKTTSVDIRADVYSLGCTLYHLLAGQPPFWESDLRPEKAHEREQLPPLRAGAALAPELWDVLQKMTAKRPEERYSDPAELVAALAPLAAGHHLARLVRKVAGRSQRPTTQGFAKGETMVAKSAESDTRLSGGSAGWSLSKSLPPASRRKLWRAAVGVGMLAAVAAIGWLVMQATGRRDSLQQSRQRLLQVAANSAASQIRNEIDLRFRILQQLARDKTLRQTMVEIDAAPGDEALWEPLRDWLGARKLEGDQQAGAESWFISDARGTQVSRSPWSDSVGHNYAYRDYFNGQGRDFAPGAEGLTPIASPHLSTVYESSSDKTLRVAFSTPIDNGLSGPTARKVVGVLAMSVDLGEFNVLENVLDRAQGQEVVLVDMRDDYLSGQPQRGLILHHRRSDQFRKGEPPQRLSAEMLTRIDAVLAAQEQTRRPNQDVAQLPPQNFLGEYSDPLAADSQQKYWGAVERVILSPPGGEQRDTGWLVLVQEPVSR
jgi:serine/threonine protein kinase/class 3 adenylate cyclase/type II secretory pathway pseudopilin PulG